MSARPWIALAMMSIACRRETPPAPSAAGPAEPIQLYDGGEACVYFKNLQHYLPDSLPGWIRSSDEGSTGKYREHTISEVQRIFTQGERKELSVRIIDTTLIDDLRATIKAAARDAAAREDEDPTAAIVLANAVGFVRYDGSSAKAEANLLVGDRFVVRVASTGVEGTSAVRGLALDLDLAGLSKLR